MKPKAYYQGKVGDIKIVEGAGDADHLNREAVFLAYHGHRLARLLRKQALKVVAIAERNRLNAAGFPGGYEPGIEKKVCGIVGDEDMAMGQILDDLQWTKL